MKKVLLFFVLLSLSVFAHEGAEGRSVPLFLDGYSVVLSLPERIVVGEPASFSVVVEDSSHVVVYSEGVGTIMKSGQEVFITPAVVDGDHLFFSWTPNFAGEYDVEFILRAGDVSLYPQVSFVVSDKRGENTWLASIVLAVLIVLFGVYFSVGRVKKRRVFKLSTFVKSLLFSVIVLVLGYSVNFFYAQGGEAGFVVCGDSGCDVAIHWHSQLYFDLCGSDFDLPLESGPLDMQHTHKERNYLHFHALIKSDKSGLNLLEPQKLRLGQLFDFLGIRFTDECFGDFCNGDVCNGVPGTLSVLVNGAPSSVDFSWRDGDKIEVVFK